MNKRITGPDNKKGNLADKEFSASAGKFESKPKQVAKSNSKKLKKDNIEKEQLPILVELAYTISAVVVIAATLLVILVSIFTQASLLDLIIRSSVTMVVLGCLAMVISWQISAGMLTASLAEQEEEKTRLENLEKSKENMREGSNDATKEPQEESFEENFEANYGHGNFGESKEMSNEGIFEAQ